MRGEHDISILRQRLRELLLQNREMRHKLALQIAENRKMSKELTRALEATLSWGVRRSACERGDGLTRLCPRVSLFRVGARRHPRISEIRVRGRPRQTCLSAQTQLGFCSPRLSQSGGGAESATIRFTPNNRGATRL